MIKLRYSTKNVPPYVTDPATRQHVLATYVRPGRLRLNRISPTVSEQEFLDRATYDEYLSDPLVVENNARRLAHYAALGTTHGPLTITDEHVKLNADLHARDPRYGTGGGRFSETVEQLVKIYKSTTVLDYGSGKGNLATQLPKLTVLSYDPALVDLPSTSPRMLAPVKVVTCIDVLEHVEPELLDGVLSELSALTLGGGFIAISNEPAKKKLADGRNAHLIVENLAWWTAKLSDWFRVWQAVNATGELLFQVSPRAETARKLKLVEFRWR